MHLWQILQTDKRALPWTCMGTSNLQVKFYSRVAYTTFNKSDPYKILLKQNSKFVNL